MAALNWAMLTPQGHPVPLPQEKFLFSSTPTIAVSLFPHPPGAQLNVQPAKDSEYKAAGGTLHVSSKRVVYVAPAARSASGGGGAGPSHAGVPAQSASAEDGGSLATGQASIVPGGLPASAVPRPPLHTLSVPIRYFVDGRFVQPWFTAAYYEALCLEGDGSGGLDTAHLVRFYFKEGGGYDFYAAVEEVKARAEMSSGRRGTPVEQLPAYEPPPRSSSTAGSSAADAHAAPSLRSSSFLPSTPTGPSHPPHSSRTSSSPTDLAAAQVAIAADAAEQQHAALELRRGGADGGGGGGNGDGGLGVGEGEAPPGYEER